MVMAEFGEEPHAGNAADEIPTVQGCLPLCLLFLIFCLPRLYGSNFFGASIILMNYGKPERAQ